MGKEAKIGVAFIALLLGVFGFVLYKRLKESQPPAVQAPGAETSEQASATADAAEKPKLSSGPLKAAAARQSSPAPGATTQDTTDSSTARNSYSRYNDPFATGASGEATTDSGTSSAMSRSRYGNRYGSSSPPVHTPDTHSSSDAATTTAPTQRRVIRSIAMASGQPAVG